MMLKRFRACGLPRGPNMRIRLLAGVSVVSPSFSKPTVALMVLRRIALPVSTSPASIVSIPSRSRFSAKAASLATRRCTSSLKLFVRATRASRPSDEFEAEFTADQGRGALKALDRDVSLGFQNAINLGAACVHALSKRRLSNALPFHFLAQLPSQHARQRFGLRGFTNAFLAEEGVQSRAPMGVLFRAHSSISFIRRRARS